MKTKKDNKVMLGDVDVEDDGDAHLIIPSYLYDFQVHLIDDKNNYNRIFNGSNHLWNINRNIIQGNIQLRKLYAAIIVITTCGWHSMQINIKFHVSFLNVFALIFLTLSTAFPAQSDMATNFANNSFTNYEPLLRRLKLTNNNQNRLENDKCKYNKTHNNCHHHLNKDIALSSYSLFEKLNLIKIETTTFRSNVSYYDTDDHNYDVTSTQQSEELFNRRSSIIHNNSTNKNESIMLPLSTAKTLNTEEICEAKILDDIPPEPFYDFRDITEEAAQKFLEFLRNKYLSSPPNIISNELRNEAKKQANVIVANALNEDDNLLAFVISAPSINMVVVKFRDNVTLTPENMNNRDHLSLYLKDFDYEWESSGNSTQEWGAPFKDCNFLIGRWLWPFRMTFYDSRIKLIVAAFIAADEDVCNDNLEQIFGRKHGCDRNTTFCLLTENKPVATRDVYMCICKESYYLPNSTLQGFRGDLVEMSEDFDNYSCIPCPGACTTCDLNGVCIFGEAEDSYSLESIFNQCIGISLASCIICCLSISIVIFKQRKSKVIAFGMWTVLEIILIGILLLYLSVAVHFFPASTKRCLLEPWLRELGFITCYGAIILKLYRHLIHFRTRKAHRWIFRDVDLLKYLSTMIFAVVCYMSAFMASALDLLESTEMESLREIRTNTCRPLKWEYVTEISEILILVFGLYLAVISRNAITYFKERQFLVATLIIEFFVSSTYYLLRFLYLPEMSPSTILLVLFLRSQLTTSVALGFIFVPKLWYLYKHNSSEIEQQRGGFYAGLCFGDPEVGELAISEMSPEDIRAELKRLYTQLEILKNKTLRQDNPHISKRRGGRKIGHRRFSLQKKGSKIKTSTTKPRYTMSHHSRDIADPEPSRTPEDSICSNEAPTDLYHDISGTSQCILP